jgi:trypsin
MIAIDTSPVQGRIVGGTVVTPHEFPWQVFLTISTSEGTFFCGGSVIMRQYVLTAAHCVTDYLGDLYNASQIRVYAGVHDRRQLNTVRTQGRTGLQVSVHRLYNAERYDYDVAVIKLNAPFTLNAYVKTIQLAKPTEHSLFATGTDVTVSGWGIIEDGNVPSILRKTTVDIISTAACNAKNSYDGAVTNRMLCAARTGKDSCQGDSGGPLFLRQGSIYKQVGVVSWGNGCALARYPGVYSNIGVLRAWIATKVPALP